jgi:putative DNA primase/helicase
MTNEQNGTTPAAIQIAGGELTANMADAIEALRAAHIQIFNRGGQLVRPVRIDSVEPIDTEIRRSAAATVLVAVDKDWIRLRLAAPGVARWFKLTAENKVVAIDPPKEIAASIANVPDEGDWPRLRAIVRHPLLALDGKWFGTPGYYAGLLVDIEGDWTEPGTSRDDALKAIERLNHHIRYFQFETKADHSVALSLLITAVMRAVLDTAPAHFIDAPTAGSGKSLLIDGASILATGCSAAVMDYGRNDEEFSKRLDGMLLAGDALISIDNIEVPVGGSALCTTLTATTRRIRPLGGSGIVTVPTASMITGTGNNIELRGDIVRRAITARLNPDADQPELRHFDQDFTAETVAHRDELVRACHTIVRAYLASPRNTRVSPFGSFETWNKTARAALLWLDQADPLDVQERTRGNDPERTELHALLAEWHAASREWVTAKGLIGVAAEIDEKYLPKHQRLRDALAVVAAGAGTGTGKKSNVAEITPATLGYWFRKRKDSSVAGYVLRKKPGNLTVSEWRVEKRVAGDTDAIDDW